ENIEKQREEAELEAYRIVIPGAETFEKSSAAAAMKGEVYGTKFGRTFINEAVTGKDASGKFVGYAVSVTSSEGYDGNVTISVGISTDGSITSISFTELHETPGKGILCGDPAFKDQFNGRNVTSFKLLKDGGSTAENEIDGVSGATVTSKAVVNAVNAALDFYHNVMGGN
ncbi:MAG: FMN-binding protein, partial [Lachnospiraceae bacterium]|nr:FMN-binding protein [Lachnospiraceae bacterium]